MSLSQATLITSSAKCSRAGRGSAWTSSLGKELRLPLLDNSLLRLTRSTEECQAVMVWSSAMGLQEPGQGRARDVTAGKESWGAVPVSWKARCFFLWWSQLLARGGATDQHASLENLLTSSRRVWLWVVGHSRAACPAWNRHYVLDLKDILGSFKMLCVSWWAALGSSVELKGKFWL